MSMAQSSTRHSPILGRKEPPAKAKLLLPSSQLCTWEWQCFPGGTDIEATLILCNNCAQREMLTLSHTDGSRCQAQPPYGREIICQHVLNSHSPVLARQGTRLGCTHSAIHQLSGPFPAAPLLLIQHRCLKITFSPHEA